MASTPTLVPYSLHRKTMLSADSSSFGLGAALLQLVDGVWKPVAFASRSLSSAEQRYAQIEKEALAICWACEKFHYFWQVVSSQWRLIKSLCFQFLVRRN